MKHTFLLLLAAWCASWALVGCQPPVVAGAPCTSASSCGAPLVCRLGRCRSACAVNRDCPLGAQCFLDPDGLGACQLDVDRSCGSDACGAGLTCLGTECVRECSGASDCPSDGVCARASGASVGVCTDARDPIDGGIVDASMESSVPDANTPPPDVGVDAGVCSPFVADHVCVGRDFGCAIVSADGSVACWGQAAEGVLGSAVPTGPECARSDGSTAPCRPTPLRVPTDTGEILTGAIEIGCGDDFACAVVRDPTMPADTTVRCWGRSYAFMRGNPALGTVGAFPVVDDHGVALRGAFSLRVGASHACVRMTIGSRPTVWCWGLDDTAQLARGTATAPNVGRGPNEATTLAPFGVISELFTMSGDTCVSPSDVPDVRCTGDNENNQLGTGTGPTHVYETVMVEIPATTVGSPIVISGGDDFTCYLDRTAHVRCWGNDVTGALGRMDHGGSSPFPDVLYGDAGTVVFQALFSGATRETNCAISTDGAHSGLWCWGANGDGQAGEDPGGDAFAISMPHSLTGAPRFREGSCGQQSCCGIDGEGQLWCWGRNDLGQLARGATGPSTFTPGLACAP